MKYLIQHTKELIITIGVFVSVALVVLWAVVSIIKGTFSYENVVALGGVIFEMLGWYYNMPTSEENCEATGKMRLQKAQNKGEIAGEDFVSIYDFEGDDEYEEDKEGGDLNG